MSDIITTKDNDQKVKHTGAMIAYFLPIELSRQLALSDDFDTTHVTPTPADEMHITLIYLGDSESNPELAKSKAAIIQLLAEFAENYNNYVQARIGGIGRFFNGDEDGNQAFYASVDSTDLHEFRRKLVNQLKAKLNVVSPSTFAYTPHITLAYVAEGEPLPHTDIDDFGFSIDTISLAWGDERVSFPIGKSPVVTTKEEPKYGATAGQTISGNLARGGNGQFAAAGNASQAADNDNDVNQARNRLRQAMQKRRDTERNKRDADRSQVKTNQEASKKQDIEAKAKARRDSLGDITANVLGDEELAELFTVENDDPTNLLGIVPEYGDRLVAKGLATKDGELYELNSNGNAFVKAAQNGDVKRAKLAKIKGQMLAQKGKSQEDAKRKQAVDKVNAQAKKLMDRQQKAKKKTTKELGGFQELATTLKHLTTHDQKTHGRPGIGSLIKKAMRKDNLGRVDARRKVAKDILDNPKAPAKQLQAVKRLFPTIITPKKMSKDRLNSSLNRINDIETETETLSKRLNKLPKKDTDNRKNISDEISSLRGEQSKLRNDIDKGEAYQKRVGSGGVKPPSKASKAAELKEKLAKFPVVSPRYLAGSSDSASKYTDEEYSQRAKEQAKDLKFIKAEKPAAYEKILDNYRGLLARTGPNTAQERGLKELFGQLKEPTVKPKADTKPSKTAELKQKLTNAKAKPESKPKIDPKARITKAFGSDNNKIYEFENEIVELDDLITSNTENGAINPVYSQELQPRLRERQASKLQIQGIAKTFVPEGSLLDFHTLDRGPAIIGNNDNMVESGNGRTMAMQLMAKEYPEKWAEYQNKLRESLSSAGLSEADLEGKKNPVLVRRRKSEVNRTEFAKEANRPPVLQMSALEQALVDQNLISDNNLEQLSIDDDQTIDQALRSPKNRSFIQSFTGKLSAAERAPLMRGDGTLSQQGLMRVKAAVFTKLFPGESGTRLADTFLESLDSNIKNFESGISASMPKLARAESLISGGRRNSNLRISEDLSKTIDMLARLKENGPPVEKYLAQVSMFEEELSPFQKYLLQHFNSISNRPKAIREFMQGYADAIEASPDPNQGSLFGDMGDSVTKESIVQKLIAQAAAGKSDGQASMFKENGEIGLGEHFDRMFTPLKRVAPLKPKNRVPSEDSLAAALNWDKFLPKADVKIMIDSNQSDSGDYGFTVFKEAKTGKSRWLIRTSTAFKDRDGQIVSMKALKDAVDHMDATGKHGTLRWWHVGDVNGGLDLGDCDFSMLSPSGKTLIEMGTFRNEELAIKLKNVELEVSPGFKHSLSEPDKDGVFHEIEIFERSLLPRGRASNMFTSFHAV